MYVYIYIYIYIYIYMYVYLFIYVYTYIHIYIYMHIYIHIFIYMYTCMHEMMHADELTTENTFSYVAHDSFIYVTRLIYIHIRDTTDLHMQHDSCIRATWLTQMCALCWMGAICGVAAISRIPKIIGLFCKRALWKRRYSAKETCHFKEPTNRSHPISHIQHCHVCDCVWHDSIVCVTLLSYMWHDSSIGDMSFRRVPFL